MSPPCLMATLPERRNTSAVTPESLVRDAGLLMSAVGLVRSRSWISRVVRDFSRGSIRGLLFGDYLAARLELNAQQRAELYARSEYRYVLCYADPTGESAVRNVMAQR